MYIVPFLLHRDKTLYHTMSATRMGVREFQTEIVNTVVA